MLDKPKKLTDEEIYSRCREDIEAAEEVQTTQSVSNAKNYQYYRAQKMGDEVPGRSQIVASDVFETVEWLLPALMDIYSQENGTPEFEPVGPEDEAAAQAMTELVRYQFWRQNDGETLLRQAIKDALLYRPGGIIKYAWEKAVRREKQTHVNLTMDEARYLTSNPEVSVTGSKETGYGFNVDTVRTVTEFDGPKFYLLPQHEFLIHPNARTIEEAQFVCHKKRVTADYLRRMGQTGFYENVEEAITENQGGGTVLDYSESIVYSEDDLSRDEEPSGDPARREMDLYECYTQLDTDGDGILENRIITLVGKVIIRNVDNVYGHAPFVVLQSIEDMHKFPGIPLADMVLDLQRLRTFLLRQMVNNMAQGGNSRKVYDPSKINQADVLNNVPGAPIRVKTGVSPRDAIVELTMDPLNPVHFSVLEYATQLGEQRTGVTKSAKGVGDQYNETATGQLAAINQASVRVRMIAKVLASGLAPLFRAMVMMNKKFLARDVSIRLSERKFLQIAPDDLEGKMDLALNIVMGAQSRQQTVINMQQLLAVLGQLQQGGLPVLDANNVPNILQEIVKAMGYKNQDRFMPLVFLQAAEVANQQMAQTAMGGAGGVGGDTIGSIAGGNGGASATVNPTGAGVQNAFSQPGAGGMVQGLPG